VGRISKLTTSGKAVDAAISPNSRYVLYVLDDSGRYSIRLRELKTGADVERIESSDAIYSDLSFTPDNNAFYYLRDEKRDVRTLYRAPLTEGTPTKIIDDVDSPVAISPDGSQIEFFRNRPATGDTALYVAAADGSRLRQFAVRPYTRKFVYSGAAWSGDSKSIFTGAFDAPERAGIIQVRVSNGKETKLSGSDWRWIGRVSLISHGRGLAFPAAGLESISPQIYKLSLGENNVSAITADLASYSCVSASARNHGGVVFGLERVPYVAENDSYQVEAPYSAGACGKHELFVVVHEGTPDEVVQSVGKVKVDCRMEHHE
jgi:Tol biopolymer transport system component